MAYGKEAPDLVIANVSYMYASLPPDGFETQNLHLENWGAGGSVLNFTLPQGSLRKSKTIWQENQFLKTVAQVQTKFTPVIQRDRPEYYTADIKSHKNLVINKREWKIRCCRRN